MAQEALNFYAGDKDISAAGTPEALTTRQLDVTSVVIFPKAGNTNPVFLAEPATPSNRMTIPSSGVAVPINDPRLIFIDVTTNSEGVEWAAV